MSKKRKLSKSKAEKESGSDSDYNPELEEPPKKKRRKNTNKNTKSKQKKKQQRLTKKRVNEFKKKMNEYVKRLAKMVNLDWHDGWEEQGEELQEYYQYLQEPATVIYEYTAIKQQDYDKLNEILKNMADSWDNIHAIPFRGGVELGDTDFDLHLTEIGTVKNFYASPSDLISFLWSLMLFGCCGNEEIQDQEIYRYIKDAVDNNVDILDGTKSDDIDDGEEEKEGIIEQHQCLKDGENRLKELFANKQEWKALPSTKKTHKMRRAIDRRFDGALHLRTRDYHLYDDEW